MSNLAQRRKKEAPKVKQESRPSRPLFEIDDERKLRRPQMTMAGTMALPDDVFQVIEIEPVQGWYGPTYIYVLVRLDGDGKSLDAADENNLLRLSQIKLKRDSRENTCPTSNPCPIPVSAPTRSLSPNPSLGEAESTNAESVPEDH